MNSIKSIFGRLSIYEVITSKVWTAGYGQDCYFTIYYLPTQELKVQRGETKEEVMVCLHMPGKVFYFCYRMTIKALTACAKWEWRRLELLDSLQMLFVVRKIFQRVKDLVESANGKFSTLTSILKHFLSPKLPRRDLSIHPMKYTLVGR